jgi:CMP-N-acetylneuraminic acid synthetase
MLLLHYNLNENETMMNNFAVVIINKDHDFGELFNKPYYYQTLKNVQSTASIKKVFIVHNGVQFDTEHLSQDSILYEYKFDRISSNIDLKKILSALLAHIQKSEITMPDSLLLFNPLFPVRSNKIIEDIVSFYFEKGVNYLKCFSVSIESPFKMWVNEDEKISPVAIHEECGESCAMPRQILPKILIDNGCVEIINVELLRNSDDPFSRFEMYQIEEDALKLNGLNNMDIEAAIRSREDRKEVVYTKDKLPG